MRACASIENVCAKVCYALHFLSYFIHGHDLLYGVCTRGVTACIVPIPNIINRCHFAILSMPHIVYQAVIVYALMLRKLHTEKLFFAVRF